MVGGSIIRVIVENAHFGEWVKWQRARKRWKKTRLAREIGADQKTILNIERKETPEGIQDTNISGLARVFGMSERELLERWKTDDLSAPVSDSAGGARNAYNAWPAGLPDDFRADVVREAAARKMSVAEWIVEAIRNHLPAERGEDEDEEPNRPGVSPLRRR